MVYGWLESMLEYLFVIRLPNASRQPFIDFLTLLLKKKKCKYLNNFDIQASHRIPVRSEWFQFRCSASIDSIHRKTELKKFRSKWNSVTCLIMVGFSDYKLIVRLKAFISYAAIKHQNYVFYISIQLQYLFKNINIISTKSRGIVCMFLSYFFILYEKLQTFFFFN